MQAEKGRKGGKANGLANFNKRVAAEALRADGYTQKETAEALGVSQSVIAKWQVAMQKTPTHKGRQGQIEKPLSCCQLAAFLTAGIRSLLSSIRSMRMSVIEGANHGFSLVKSITAKTHETASTSEPLPK